MKITALFAIGLLSSSLIGCASSSGSHDRLGSHFDKAKIASLSDLQLTVDAKPGIPALKADRERIGNQIIATLKKEAPTRFQTINSTTPGASTLKANVQIKTYEEGNAFARFMLAGLGQMHIDADVTLSDISNNPLTQYEVTKTFAWGGIYGASTDIRDAEIGFCKAVADALLEKD